MKLLLATSTVEFAGRRFPACALRCPDHKAYPQPPDDRVLGGTDRHGCDVYVPCESGVLAHVRLDHGSPVFSLSLTARTCVEHSDMGDIMWLPHLLSLSGREVIAGSSDWYNCEPWWVVEFIDRVSTYAYTEPPGPACELLPLSAAAEHYKVPA